MDFEDEAAAVPGTGRCDEMAFREERSCRLKLSFSSPVSCRKVQLRLLQVSLRKKAEQYFVVPYCALSRVLTDAGRRSQVTYFNIRPPCTVPSRAAMQSFASSLFANVT